MTDTAEGDEEAEGEEAAAPEEQDSFFGAFPKVGGTRAVAEACGVALFVDTEIDWLVPRFTSNQVVVVGRALAACMPPNGRSGLQPCLPAFQSDQGALRSSEYAGVFSVAKSKSWSWQLRVRA